MKTIIGIGLLLASFQGICAPQSNSNNSYFYYQIGGAKSISVPPNPSVKTTDLSAAYEYGLGYSCGNFNPLQGVADEINSLKNIPNRLLIGSVGAVTSAISSLPALVLQRMDPGLYDMFQNALIRAEATISLANKSCEDYEKQIRQGENPYSDWTSLSKGIDWKFQMGTGGKNSAGVSVKKAKDNVEARNGDNGLPWLGGARAGGVSQTPIKATSDVVRAGYNLTLNRKAEDTSVPTTSSGTFTPRMVEVFKTPEEAEKFSIDVLGDVYIRTFNNRQTVTTPGFGLLPKIAKEDAAVTKKLSDLVSGKTQLTTTSMSPISSNDVMITADVIQAIKRMQPSEQAIAISKLASETAMSRVMEKAMLTRRMLVTGLREPNVSQTPAVGFVNKSIAQLDSDIENIIFEKRVHTELASKTPQLILDLDAQHVNRGLSSQAAPGSDAKIVEDGAIK